MDESDSAKSKGAQQPENLANENAAQEKSYQAHRTEDIPSDDIDEVERWFRDIGREWLDLGAIKQCEFAVSVIGIAVLAVYTFFTALMYGANREAANAAKSAADTAASQLELSQRPWITVDTKPDGPLLFDKSGGRIEFVYDLKNIGNSPAMKVWKDEEIYLTSLRRPGEIGERDRFCAESSRRGGNLGQTIFPKDSYQERTSVPIARDQIDAMQADFRKSSGNTFQFLPAYLITCVAYSPSFNPTTRYYTGAIYDLQKRSRENPVGLVRLRVDENVSASEIVLVPSAGTLAR